MLRFSLLSSGSRANCLFVSDGDSQVLIDCGLSGRQTEARLRSIGVEPESIQAVVVTHEHSDHVSGARIFAARHKCAVFANQSTYAASAVLQQVPTELLREFRSGERFSIGNIAFEPFSVMHDASDPVAFRVSENGSTLGVLTDLGQVTTLVRDQMQNLDALILEANHDHELLHQAPYPWEVKQRIKGRSGHLSNEAAGEFLKELRPQAEGRLQTVIAAHISENSNTPELACKVLRESWGESGDFTPSFIAASVDSPTEVCTI